MDIKYLSGNPVPSEIKYLECLKQVIILNNEDINYLYDEKINLSSGIILKKDLTLVITIHDFWVITL
jgi:hypothetical protein